MIESSVVTEAVLVPELELLVAASVAAEAVELPSTDFLLVAAEHTPEIILVE